MEVLLKLLATKTIKTTYLGLCWSNYSSRRGSSHTATQRVSCRSTEVTDNDGRGVETLLKNGVNMQK